MQYSFVKYTRQFSCANYNQMGKFYSVSRINSEEHKQSRLFTQWKKGIFDLFFPIITPLPLSSAGDLRLKAYRQLIACIWI